MSDSPLKDSQETAAPVVPVRPILPDEKPGSTEPEPATPPSTEAQPSETQPTEPTATPDPTQPGQKANWAGVALDSLLVLLLIAVLAGGGYYLKVQLDKYRVPTLMEITMRQNLELCQKREALQDASYHADEQIHMRQLLARLERKHEAFSRDMEEKKADIEEQHNRVLALQHEIRQFDRESRQVALSLLPGMPIGHASTTTGKSYRNAVIHRLEGRLITLRTPEGQVRFPTSQLVKDTLPTLARYAFGQEDLVDMSDFELTGESAGATAPHKKGNARPTTPQKQTSAPRPADYEPAAGAPVVDTDANKTTTTGSTEDIDNDVAPWQAPSGDLPM